MRDYYQINAHTYHEETFHLDSSSFLGPLVRRLTAGCRVLDIGCASGRDLVWCQRQGFRVMGFERSSVLAELARQHADCEVIVGDFRYHDFTSLSVDAVLMSGSLVHIPHDDLPMVLENILPALRRRDPDRPAADGWVYLSLKAGDGILEDPPGRTFYLWSDEALRAVFRSLDLVVCDFRSGPSADGSGKVWLGYVLQKRNRSA